MTNHIGETALDIAEAELKKADSEDKKFYSLAIDMFNQKVIP